MQTEGLVGGPNPAGMGPNPTTGVGPGPTGMGLRDSGPQSRVGVAELLEQVLELGASDLHLTAGAKPTVRVNGRLGPLERYPVLQPAETQAMIYSILTQRQRERLEAEGAGLRPRPARQGPVPAQRLRPARLGGGRLPADPPGDQAPGKSALSRFCRTLAAPIRSGVPILQGLEIVAETVNNLVISRAVRDVQDSVREGESLATPLSKHAAFPAMVVQMMAVGEETGALDTMLSKVADFYDQEVEAAMASLTSMIEPIHRQRLRAPRARSAL